MWARTMGSRRITSTPALHHIEFYSLAIHKHIHSLPSHEPNPDYTLNLALNCHVHHKQLFQNRENRAPLTSSGFVSAMSHSQTTAQGPACLLQRRLHQYHTTTSVPRSAHRRRRSTLPRDRPSQHTPRSVAVYAVQEDETCPKNAGLCYKILVDLTPTQGSKTPTVCTVLMHSQTAVNVL